MTELYLRFDSVVLCSISTTACIWIFQILRKYMRSSCDFSLSGPGGWFFSIFMLLFALQYSYFTTALVNGYKISFRTAGEILHIISGFIAVAGSLLLIYYINTKAALDYKKKYAEKNAADTKNYYNDLFRIGSGYIHIFSGVCCIDIHLYYLLSLDSIAFEEHH